MDSTFTTKIGEKFMDSLVSNALSGMNNNSNSSNSNGTNTHQHHEPRQYGGYQGPPQWYRGRQSGRQHTNQLQGGGDRPPLHDKVDAIGEQLKALVGTHKKSYMVRSEESILLNKIHTEYNTTIGNTL